MTKKAAIWHQKGKQAKGLGNFDECIRCWKKAAELYKKVSDKLNVGIMLFNIGNVYSNQELYEEALEHYEQALEIFRALENKVGEATCLNNIGIIYDDWGRLNEALEHYEQALEIFRALENKDGEATNLTNIGIIYFKWGRLNEALEYYEQALEINKALGSKDGEARDLTHIGTIYNNWGRPKGALEYYELALEIFRALGNKKGEAACLTNIGIIYDDWGRPKEALEYYEQSLEINKALGSKDGEARDLTNIGTIYNYWSFRKKALEYYEQALEIFRALGNKDGEATNLTNIGFIYNNWGRLKEALEYYEQALKISKALGSKKGEARDLTHIGDIYNDWGRSKEALEYYEQALEINKALGNKKGEAICLRIIGILFMDKLSFSKGVECLKEAFVIKDYLASSAPSAAIRIKARAEQQRILPSLVSCLLSLDDMIVALAYIEHNKGREMILDLHRQKKEVNPQLAKLTDQLTTIDERIQKIAREYSLLQKLKEKHVITQEAYGEKIRHLQKQEKQLENDRSVFQQQIWQEFPTKGTALPSKPEELITAFQQEIPPKWIILDYFHDKTEKRYLIFVLQKDKEIQMYRTKVIDQEEQQQLAQSILRIHNTIRSINRDNAEEELAQIGKKLYKLLIPSNLADYLQQNPFDYLTIIPSGSMHSYPLELLHDDVNYWGLKYAMTRAFNLQTLRAALYSRKEERKQYALLVGNPTANMMIPLSKIYGEEVEGIIDASLQRISKDLVELEGLLQNEGYTTHRLSEENADESTILSMLNGNPYSLIHFATHALFNAKHPNYSHLLLREGSEISELYAHEIPVKTVLSGNPLVNLVACESGGVETELGDEVFGLARGFIEAGALSIIMTGWIVREFYACLFFKDFYDLYITLKLPIAEVLRLARVNIQNSLRTHDDSEFYPDDDLELIHWGAYMYYGLPF